MSRSFNAPAFPQFFPNIQKNLSFHTFLLLSSFGGYWKYKNQVVLDAHWGCTGMQLLQTPMSHTLLLLSIFFHDYSSFLILVFRSNSPFLIMQIAFS